ncbi:UNVERIFIED_CONTAM: HtaA domain-containing protein, partial [Salmonella enterica subsp. enterica serovar Weltevreden]
VANLDLSAAKRSEKDGAVTWAGATAALRTEAVGTFLDRYKAGTAMDPVTFTVGAAAVAPGDEDPSVIVHPVSVAGGALEVLG